MKRSHLIKRIKEIARSQGLEPEFVEGSKHTKVVLGARQTTVPRHNEINEFTAQGIIKYLEGEK